MPSLVRPFGPSILIDEVSSNFVEAANCVGDRILGDAELSKRLDWSHMLAGNVHREVRVVFGSAEERDLVVLELKEKCLSYYRSLRGHSAPDAGDLQPDDLEFRGMWLVSQRAGDFNPYHCHGGDLSGVVYLRLPASIEDEWQDENHSPSAGMIEFFDGRPSPYVRTGYMLRPTIGMILLFPSWLPHSVYPFRSQGERRSMSFNVAIKSSPVSLIPHASTAERIGRD